MDLLVYPLRFAGGRIPVVDDGTEQGITQQLRILVGTRRGERVLAPQFGITDPAFRAGIDPVDVQAGVELYGPAGVRVDVQARVTATAQTALLTWTRADATTGTGGTVT